jgi:hypothetical protein
MPIDSFSSLLVETDQSPIQPLPCDRWIARSCLQKAIRRADEAVAVRALANLFLHDPNAIWRHLTVIALEDVGVAKVEALHRIVSAKSAQQAKRAPGHLWHTFVDLTRELARAEHSQAICDLLLRMQNDPAVGSIVHRQAEAFTRQWAETIYDSSAAIEESAAAAMSFGGFMPARRPADPVAVFEIAAENSECAPVADVAKGAWKLSRNPMALLLPIVWQRSGVWSGRALRDDSLQPAEIINGIPAYSFDQFTRVGKSALREAVRSDLDLQQILASAGVRSSQWTQVTGDLIFLIEGGLCARRATWNEAEELRQPARWLPSVAWLGPAIQPAMQHVASNRRLLNEARQQLFPRAR